MADHPPGPPSRHGFDADPAPGAAGAAPPPRFRPPAAEHFRRIGQTAFVDWMKKEYPKVG